MANKKHNQRRRKHRELVGSFFIGNTQKSTCCPEFNMQDFSSKKKLDCSLEYYYTACWTKNHWIQTNIQTSFQQRCAAVPRGLVVVAELTCSSCFFFFFVVRGEKCSFARPLTGPTSGVGCVAAMAARFCTEALWHKGNGTLKPHEGVFSTRGKQSATRFALQRGSSGNCLEIEKPAVHLAVSDVCHIPAQGPVRWLHVIWFLRA